ncbi:tRNA (adenosine(37)-N6)-threonylcarbamoyltransferase complex ATPase subunit type 1 TsaE [Algihabitans albus]|uniref:tRNA (adenosine(37)-N6)-threonylcarbamoyltransferase complex ATPase subunit type 1 TsaE n=1 Tax=Algihabitans albus TaxID=2164067 RepID=UPI000E5D7188|nr:tRNA (adenosine(37)-N6)-threonylcarbamoyltransferase complex ATPase subunit type 1 TsaE [Algihabitans albus]
MGLPVPEETRVEVQLSDKAATEVLAARLAPLLRRGDVVALSGGLGAGKTAFCRALINALPGPAEEVPSPTFTLAQVYERGDRQVWHFDFYRLKDPDEVWELGLEEALAEGISLIEWPERLGSQLPRDRLDLHLATPLADAAHEQTRLATLCGQGAWAARLAAQAQELAGP